MDKLPQRSIYARGLFMHLGLEICSYAKILVTTASHA